MKSIVIGPANGNQCCVCCDKPCDNTKQYDLGSNACPQRCCPCPTTGDVIASFTATNCGNGSFTGIDITLTKEMGLTVCSGDNPVNPIGVVPCYTTSGPAIGQNHPYEKWAFSGLLCSGDLGSECSGQNTVISLCCCDFATASEMYPSGTGDCHSCNYQLRIESQVGLNPTSSSDPCTCPPNTGMMPVQHLVPGNTSNIGNGPNIVVLGHQSGNCDSSNSGNAWMMNYKLDNQWWNCDCCEGGDPINGNVDISVTITPA